MHDLFNEQYIIAYNILKQRKQKITHLLAGIPDYTLKGNKDLLIADVTFDSRQVKADTLFFAIKGVRVDGHLFIDKAIAAGATAIVCERLPERLKEEITYISVPDSAEAMGTIAADFYGNLPNIFSWSVLPVPMAKPLLLLYCMIYLENSAIRRD